MKIIKKSLFFCIILNFINACECDAPKHKKEIKKQAKKEHAKVITNQKTNKNEVKEYIKFKDEHQNMDINCKKEIITGDSMEYLDAKSKNKIQTIEIPANCINFSIKLSHVGKLSKNIMGHNIIISHEDDIDELVKHTSTRRSQDYLPDLKHNKVLAASNVTLGGGENDYKIDYFSFSTKKIKANKKGDFKFFCSFLGHSAMMKGTIKLK